MFSKGKILLLAVLFLGAGALLWGLLRHRGDAKRKDGDAGTVIAFPDRQAHPRLQPVVGPGAMSLSGHLRGADGTPVHNAAITATLEPSSSEPARALPGVVDDAGPLSEQVPGQAIVATTDAEGAFSLQGMDEGSYRLVIEGEDLISAELRFVECPGRELDLIVARRVRVSGVVINGKRSSAGARIFLQAQTMPDVQEQVSAGDGSFSFDTAEGSFRIWAQAPGLAARAQDVQRLGAGPFAPLVVPLEAAFHVRGRVVEAGGSELGVAAELLLRSQNGDEPEQRVLAGADGNFQFESVLAGRWIAEARAPGFLPTLSAGLSAEEQVSLRLVLDGGAKVQGQVVDGNRQVVPGAQVRLVGKTEEGNAMEYSPRHSLLALASALPGGQRLLPRGELGVLLGPIPLVPPRSGSVTRVAVAVREPGNEIEQALPLEDPSRFVSDNQGHFSISGVAAGDYRLVLSHPDFAETSSALIRVRKGAVVPPQRVVMHPGARLVGTIRDEAGLAIHGASIIVQFDDGREPLLTVSDAAGYYQFAPMRGDATIVVEAIGYSRAQLKRKLRGKGANQQDVELDLRLARADLAIEARVVDVSGFAVRGATVSAEASESLLPSAPARTDENGLFRLEGLPAGMHGLRVVHPDYPPAHFELATGQGGDLKLAYGGGLQLMVRDKQNQRALAMAAIVVTPIATGAPLRSLTDESGLARVLAIPSGRYRVAVSAAGYPSHEQELSVPAASRVGECSAELLVELTRGATLAGVLRDARGERLAGATLEMGTAQCSTDADGRFRLEQAPSGDQELRIRYQGRVAVQSIKSEAGEERVTMELVFSSQAEGGKDEELESPESDPSEGQGGDDDDDDDE